MTRSFATIVRAIRITEEERAYIEHAIACATKQGQHQLATYYREQLEWKNVTCAPAKAWWEHTSCG